MTPRMWVFIWFSW